MKNRKITRERVKQFIERLRAGYYPARATLAASYARAEHPIRYEAIDEHYFERIEPGAVWGGAWDSAWFRFEGAVPGEWAGREVVALIDTGSEACLFRDGTPWLGLTNKDTDAGAHIKRRVVLGRVDSAPDAPHGRSEPPRGAWFTRPIVPGERLELLVEAAANHIFGAGTPSAEYRLNQAELAVFDRDLWQLVLDLEYLLDLADGLDPDSTRSRRIMAGLNEAANVWADGAGRADVREIAAGLLEQPANASAPTAWSVGHAHLDLAWLWPVRETRRKGGRTFATQLRLIEEYDEYIFGASQPQLFEWVKTDYPALYEEIRTAVADGRIEPQGAMWVEPDMNLAGGEALVRQCLYGKAFFRDEFGVDVRHLWLPDVFGYSAALPQILRGCGVDVFMTQKISWNEQNTFPHHSFVWEGIDGSQVHAHFLPTNTYNHYNEPSKLIESEKRFAEGDTLGDFLNLFGVGDGGAGPSREHIERGLRGQDAEGAPRVRFAQAEQFFDTLRAVPEQQLPRWRGELYLEMHRGTYTTQAQMKRVNRRLEHLLHDVELLSELCRMEGVEDWEFDVSRAWKDTLLNQFHDILPGSSIGWVYRDAIEASSRHMNELTAERDRLLGHLAGAPETDAPEAGTPADSSGDTLPVVREIRPDAPPVAPADRLAVFNPLPWERTVILRAEPGAAPQGGTDAETAQGTNARSTAASEKRVNLPATGYVLIGFEEAAREAAAGAPVGPGAGSDVASEAPGSADRETPPVHASESLLENELLRVAIADDGSITSIYRKDLDREYLAGTANVFTLWEDYPYAWDAWEISHYYRETVPEQARLVARHVEKAGGLSAQVALSFEVGRSRIVELLTLESGSPVLRADCRIDWREDHRQLRVAAETTILSRHARYEIQYGTVERATHENTSWDEARFEVPAHRFADLSRPDAGFAVLNDCKYGYRIVGSEVELTLLKSPKYPDPDADMGEHAFAFAYMAHAGERDASAVLKAAHELNAPALALPAGARPGGADGEDRRQHSRSWFAVSGDAVKLEVIKRAEDGDGTILRLYETLGSEAEISVLVPEAVSQACLTDMLENDGASLSLTRGEAAGDGEHDSGPEGSVPGAQAPHGAGEALPAGSASVRLRFSPYEIRTLRLR